MKELLKLANEDYQKRGGEYPKANIPDSITVVTTDETTTIEFEFKNTDDDSAISWYEKSKECKAIKRYAKDYEIDVTTIQDGDYKDDWKILTVSLRKKKPNKQPSTSKSKKEPVVDATEYVYCYVLSTVSQKKALDLTKYKEQMTRTIKEFFEERLLSVEIYSDHYVLKLKDSYDVADKRRLGRLISESGLNQYVRKVKYNGDQDISGQL